MHELRKDGDYLVLLSRGRARADSFKCRGPERNLSLAIRFATRGQKIGLLYSSVRISAQRQKRKKWLCTSAIVPTRREGRYTESSRGIMGFEQPKPSLLAAEDSVVGLSLW